MNICCVCDNPVNFEGDIPIEPGGNCREVPGDGAIRCSSCDYIVHEECVAKDRTICRICGECDSCHLDASEDGDWFVFGTAEPIEKCPLGSRWRLCPSCVKHLSGVAA